MTDLTIKNLHPLSAYRIAMYAELVLKDGDFIIDAYDFAGLLFCIEEGFRLNKSGNCGIIERNPDNISDWQSVVDSLNRISKSIEKRINNEVD